MLAVVAGIVSASQHVLNMNLRVGVGSPWTAGLVSYATGTIAMLAMAIASGSSLTPSVTTGTTPWISWAGGVFGAIFISAMIVLAPRLGLATMLALVVIGQMLAAVAFDHFGLFGVPQHSASAIRFVGATFLVVGVVLIRV